MRPALALLVLATLGASAAPAREKVDRDSLLTIVSPASKVPAPAHPHVTVRVLFGSASDGTPSDPSTFRARIGGRDITGQFVQLVQNGRVIGMYAAIEPPLVKVGQHRSNRLRFSVEGVQFPGVKGLLRDKDRIRFRAVETANQPPMALLTIPGADTIIPDVPVQFDATQSTDPDGDLLTYEWDFGDGGSSTDAAPIHAYPTDTTGEVTVKLTVRDAGSASDDSRTLPSIPPLPDGKIAGLLRITADGPLEFGGVAVGASMTRTLLLENLDTMPESLVPLRIGSTDPTFALDQPILALGPGQQETVTITFAPPVAGHHDTTIAVVANAANRNAVSMLGHGFGGTAPEAGPTLALQPVFYGQFQIERFGTTTYGILPTGTTFLLDNGAHTCVSPPNGFGPGTGDICVADADCALNGGTCRIEATCPSGVNAGLVCSTPSDCPQSFCPSFAVFDPVDMCGDGKGGLYIVSDDGTFTEPEPSRETERAVSVMKLAFDPDTGAFQSSEILARVNTETTNIACDGFGAGAGGRVYLSEFFNVPDQGNCFRSEREALTSIRKSNGQQSIVMPRIDSALGFSECDDIDEVSDRGLKITADGSAVYAAFEITGLYRIRPTPLAFSPDITEQFQLHPDGSVLYAVSQNGVIGLYRITPEQVADNPLPLAGLQPCATLRIPTNGGPTGVISYAAGPAAANPADGIVLVSFRGGRTEIVSDNLNPKGTVAFFAPAGESTCSVVGLVNLNEFDFLTF